MANDGDIYEDPNVGDIYGDPKVGGISGVPKVEDIYGDPEVGDTDWSMMGTSVVTPRLGTWIGQ